MDLKKVPRGEINGIPAVNKFKIAMIELFKGYPVYRYYGIFESYFGHLPGQEVVNILEKDNLIDVIRKKGEQPLYRLTGDGINMAISMINLEYAEEISVYNKSMRKFTIWIIILTIITSLVGLIDLLKDLR